MNNKTMMILGWLCTTLALGLSAAPAKAAPKTTLTEAGQKIEARYADQLKKLKAELTGVLPVIDGQLLTAYQKARDEAKVAAAEAATKQAALGKSQSAKALVDHAKGKWIGGAEKGIKQAEAALKKATTEAEREAANKDLAKWQANKEDGLKALKERQEALDKSKLEAPKLSQENQVAQAVLAQAKSCEYKVAMVILKTMEPMVATDKLDAKLVPCAVLAEATPRGLAEFAQQGKEQESLVEKLLADTALMKQMLEAGGAKFGKYGKSMEIYTAIQKASPKAREGTLQRLALATSVEHAVPIAQSNPKDEVNAPDVVDPVKRYLHYEKAFLDGELDPAFKNFAAWEYRLVVSCDAPDHILTWGREMLRNYRPDHIYSQDYGWRYSSTVRTEVPYGSQNVKDDLPSLHNYQNIIKNGGVCGRRAFFGRFILRCFGIPTWGVTQHAHAALSHWTPKGWLVNLGAGYGSSWWDKDEAPRSGSDFLLETQARVLAQEYLKVLRAQWISRILGEQAYNDRKRIEGGLWSSMAHVQAQAIAAAAKAVDLGPLGQELGEANEAAEHVKLEQAKAAEADRKISIAQSGAITVPAVAHSKTSGRVASMKSFSGGIQLHATGGFKADYTVEVPQAGTYTFAARVVTVQTGQKFLVQTAAAQAPIEIEVPYTLGQWQQTKPVQLTLASGKNVLQVGLKEGSRGVTIKEFTLTPVK